MLIIYALVNHMKIVLVFKPLTDHITDVHDIQSQ